ncbi:BC1872 family protein [Paenibacillus polysaccharolyticus]|uniref:BC1872 family protein n=1 Tax=Paenibacillus polysaccharolyticus TaxID=582692 RepID=UPI0030082BAC
MSSRERDAWVEKTVFGGETFGEFRLVNGVRVLIPQYTTDISAAWKVVEEMRLDHFLHLTDETPYGWSVDMYPAGESIVTQDINADTAPEAIGLAAIIAKLATEE